MRSTRNLAGGMMGRLRAIVLTAIALAIATPLLVESAPASERQRPSDPLVARVNGHDIHLSHVYKSIESLSLGDQIDARGDLDVYIEAMVNEEVLFQWAFRNDFKGEPDLREEAKDLVVRLLIEKHVRANINVSDEDARRYYDENPSLVRGEHVRVRRILLPWRAQCQRMMAEIGSEEEFIEMAKARSLDKDTAGEGGDTGLMMRAEGAVEGYELEFFAMEVGDMRVFEVPQGCMLVRSIFYVNPPMPPFAQVKDNIKQYLENRQEVLLVEQLFSRASRGVPVERFYQVQK